MIHFFHRSHAKKPESGLFSDWIGNNMDDLRCSDWQKRWHPLVVVLRGAFFSSHAFSFSTSNRQGRDVSRVQI